MSAAASEAVLWHDVECGAYAADLPLWDELATAGGGPVLDLGCGTGRVASHLARDGREVVGLDRDPVLVAALEDRATEANLHAVTGDAAGFDLGRAFPLAIAPMQLIQLFDGPEARAACLAAVRRHLAPGGLAAFAIVEAVPANGDVAAPVPDAREVDGWVYSSLPIDVAAGEGAIRVRRLRQIVSPAGELSESVDDVRLSALDSAALEREATQQGLRPAGRRDVPATADHVGSTVVLFERGR